MASAEPAMEGCLPGCLNPAAGVHHCKCPNYDPAKIFEVHQRELKQQQHEAAAREPAKQMNDDAETSLPFNSKVTARKSGAFTDWKEDDQVAEIFLPLPEGTVKKDLLVVIAADKLVVRLMRSQQTLLRADPLAGGVDVDESTWYLQDDLLLLVLAKQQVGASKSDQYWGASLAATGGAYECYMSPSEVKAHRTAREKAEADSEAERLARVAASRRQMRWKEQNPEAAAEAQAAERRRVRKEPAQGGSAAEGQVDGAAGRRRRVPAAKRREPLAPEESWGEKLTGLAIGTAIGVALLVAWEAFSRLGALFAVSYSEPGGGGHVDEV